MVELTEGEEYWRTEHNITGVVVSTELRKEEFSTYLIIHFQRADNSRTDCDIYWVNDAMPDKFIASVMLEHTISLHHYVLIDLLWTGGETPRQGYFYEELDAINYFISCSENNQRNHFESLNWGIEEELELQGV